MNTNQLAQAARQLEDARRGISTAAAALRVIAEGSADHALLVECQRLHAGLLSAEDDVRTLVAHVRRD